jgi:hypothetical protein
MLGSFPLRGIAALCTNQHRWSRGRRYGCRNGTPRSAAQDIAGNHPLFHIAWRAATLARPCRCVRGVPCRKTRRACTAVAREFTKLGVVDLRGQRPGGLTGARIEQNVD